jgi:hypothetical protein
MPEHPTEADAIALFEEFGMRVEKIPETREKRADLRVIGDTLDYIVEVKARDESDAWRESMRTHGHAEETVAMRANNSIDEKFKDAEKQLCRTPGAEHALRFMYVVAHPLFGSATKAYVSAAYGSVSSVSRSALTKELRILYVEPSLFRKHPRIDAPFVEHQGEVEMLLNEFSPNFESARDSLVAKRMASASAVFDPHEARARGIALDMPERFYRPTPAMLRAFEAETGLLVLDQMAAHTAAQVVGR